MAGVPDATCAAVCSCEMADSAEQSALTELVLVLMLLVLVAMLLELVVTFFRRENWERDEKKNPDSV